MRGERGVRLGVDVGGTFTDIYYEDLETTAIAVSKVRTSMMEASGLPTALGALAVDMKRVRTFVYSTTLATNAILERKLAPCALVTTRGFRDIIELGRRDRENTYGLDGSFTPLVPRHLRFEVDERVDGDGEVLVEPNADAVRALGRDLRDRGVAAIVVAFLNSYINDDNERRVAGFLAEVAGDLPIIRSADAYRGWGEFDRFTLAVLHGALLPLVGDHLLGRKAEVDSMGFAGEMFAMQSNGGVAPIDHVKSYPANLALSGPAAGVIGASAVAGHRSETIVTCDMGGTSFDVGILEHGRPGMTTRTQIGFRVPLPLATVDVHEVAAGGSSVVKVVAGQLITVGPESVGSDPGPACYGLGGELPTITDAEVVLNRFVEGQAFGSVGEIQPSLELAEAAIERVVARPLGLTVVEAAEASIARAVTMMAGGVRTMSIGRGLDPRTTMLFVAGGAGPMFGCDIAREAGIKTILVPPYPGVLNAIGCAVTDLRQDYARTVNLRLDEDGLADARAVLDSQRHAALEFYDRVRAVGVGDPMFVVEFEMQYAGQTHTVTVRVRGDALDFASVSGAFAAEYARWRGIQLKAPVNIRTIRTILLVPRVEADGGRARIPYAREGTHSPTIATQQVVLEGERVRVDVHDRADLAPGASVKGPALVRQTDCTVWIAPDADAVVDDDRSLLLTLT